MLSFSNVNVFHVFSVTAFAISACLWGSTVYEKGSWILHMLRHQASPATFIDIVKEWADRYRYDTAATADFIGICEDV